MPKHLLLSHPCLLDHGLSSHPENSGRLKAIIDALEKSSFKQLLDLSCNRLATQEELSLVHHPAYVDYVLSLDGQRADLDRETPLTAGSVKAARAAAGLGLELVEQVLDGKVQNGFALVRPPGHHAIADAGMGFCVFNNIAIAARKALSRGLKRILILDWDVHHGNGTQAAFYSDDTVFQIDLHQDNLFPKNSGLLSETGSGKGVGYTANIPLPDSCRDADYLYVFEKIVKPLARQYRPELILVSAGFDAHESDPLGSMLLTTHGYGLLTKNIKSLAYELCGGKLAFFLEGGYDPLRLAENVLECIGVLADEKATLESVEGEIHPYTYGMETLIQEMYDVHVTHSTRRAP